MILLVGIPSETPVQLVAAALDDLRQPFLLVNQRRVERYRLDFEIAHGEIEGVLSLEDQQCRLADITGVYVRAMDDAQLPELRALAPEAPERRHSQAFHEALLLWLDLTPARVLNRPAANASNGSKPWQTRMIEAAGLRTPATLVTNAPESVRSFRDHHGSIIFKSASGCRSVVRSFEPADDDRLDAIRWCPVQFQRRVPGVDVRVHVVGDQCFATRIRSVATDYRYATRDGLAADLEAFELSPDLGQACVRLARQLDLPFAGIDLRLTEDGKAWCFEANPCPGFSYYESHTGQPIAAAVARYLTGEGAD